MSSEIILNIESMFLLKDQHIFYILLLCFGFNKNDSSKQYKFSVRSSSDFFLFNYIKV